jgi:hypothetical protein
MLTTQKYSRLRCLLRVKGLVICFYLDWSGSILEFGQNIIKLGSKSWLLTCSSNITLSLPSYTGSALKRELNFCNGYLSLLYFAEPTECMGNCSLLLSKDTITLFQSGISTIRWSDYAPRDLQLPLRQWAAGNAYLLVLSKAKR